MKNIVIVFFSLLFLGNMANAKPVEKIETEIGKLSLALSINETWTSAMEALRIGAGLNEYPNNKTFPKTCFILGQLLNRLEAIELSDSLYKVDEYRDEISTQKAYLDGMVKFGLCSNNDKGKLPMLSLLVHFETRSKALFILNDKNEI